MTGRIAWLILFTAVFMVSAQTCSLGWAISQLDYRVGDDLMLVGWLAFVALIILIVVAFRMEINDRDRERVEEGKRNQFREGHCAECGKWAKVLYTKTENETENGELVCTDCAIAANQQ